ncbi:hypothetical protein LguiA_025106 [Lonicera macranthoides]
MGAVTAAVIAVVGLALGWITIEIACKPCLERGREAIDRNLNPDYDPDDDHEIHTPLNRNQIPPATDDNNDSSSTATVKIV